MKYFSIPCLLHILVIFSFAAVIHVPKEGTSIQSYSYSSPFNGGRYITSKDTLNVLAVFICFKDDTVWKAGDKYWDTLAAPTFLHTLFDSKDNYPSGKYNMSNFFRTMSSTAPAKDDRFHLTGDGVFYITPHNRDWYKNLGMVISDINAEILRRLDDSLRIDFSKYDKWRFGRDNHSKCKDSIIDMVFMIYRNVYRDNKSKYNILVDEILLSRNWSGFAGLIFPDTINLPVNGMIAKGRHCSCNSSGITMIRFPYNLTVPDSRAMGSFVHELGHFFGFGHHGENSTIPCLMNTGNQAYFSIHPYEREYLKWANYNTVTFDQEIILDDYITSGDVIKINTHSCEEKYIYITNHQLESQFDIVNGNNPDSSSGVYISGKFGCLCLLSAAGNYDWKHMGMIPNPWGENYIPIWRDTLENPNGKSPRDKHQYYCSNGTESCGYLHAYYDCDGNIDNTIHRCFGMSEDAFNESDRFMISSYTNPSILTYGGNKKGLSVEVSDKNSSSYTIKIRFDSTDTISDLPPFKPMNLKSNYNIDDGLQDHSVGLNWDANKEADVAHYQIWRSINKSAEYIKQEEYHRMNSYLDSTLPISSTGFLYYKIRAVDDDSNISKFSRYSVVDIRPHVPSLLNSSWNHIHPKLEWSYKTEPNDFKCFEVWKKESDSTGWQLASTTRNKHWTDKDEEKWNKFHSPSPVFYKIRVLDEGQNGSEYSDSLLVFVDSKNIVQNSKDSESIKFSEGNEYMLFDNYPNPFNPSTIINYELGIKSEVDLSVYNVVGQKVAILVSQTQQAGFHQVEWDAGNLASGIYYYQLTAGDFNEVRKMILIR